jgi:hypothetical protein
MSYTNAAAADAAAANVSLLSSNDSLSTDNIEAENPDVSVLNHEEQNQEMKDLLVFDLLGTKKKKAWYWKHFDKVVAIKVEAAEALYPNGMPQGLREVENLLQKGVCWACKICLENEQVAVKDAVKKATTNGSNLLSHLQTSLSGHKLSDPQKNQDNRGGLDAFVAQFRVEKRAKTTTDLKKRAKQVVENLHRIVADVINRKGLANRFCEDPDFRALCEYLVENAVYLQSADGVNKAMHVGRRRLETLQSIGLKEMLSYLTLRIKKTQEYLRSIHGQDIAGSDEECECWMHVLNLIIEHAMGIRVRTKNHEVVDEFPKAEKIGKAAKKLAIFIKANREEYKNYNKKGLW